MFKPRKFQEALPVEYTPAELAGLADQADDLVAEMERLEQLKAALPKKIESIKEQVYEVSKKRKTGFRDKMVDCETVADTQLPEVVTIRLDTGEEIARRAMTESERQEDLFPAEQASVETPETASPEERERLHRNAVAAWRREPEPSTPEEGLQILLSLVIEEPIPIETIQSWTARQREEAEKWATAAHLEVNDNDVEVPQRPGFLSINSKIEANPDTPAPQSRLTYEQLLDFAMRGTSVKNTASHAQKWHLTGEVDKTAEAWLAQQEEQGAMHERINQAHAGAVGSAERHSIPDRRRA